jgi:hypothetical protein
MSMIKKSKIVVSTRNNDLKVELYFRDDATDEQISKWLVQYSELAKCKKCGVPVLKFASRDGMCWNCFSKGKAGDEK